MWIAIGAFVVIAIASSTTASRATGREMVKRWERPALMFTIVAWLIIVTSMFLPS